MFIESITVFLHSIVSILCGIIGIGFLIGFHELGHFLFCKLFRIATPSFSIGFGPKLISKRIGDTEFSLSLLPLGGYVEIAGAAEVGQGEQKEAHSTDQYSFAVKPFYQKFLVMVGGIAFNLLFAYAAIICIFLYSPQTSFLLPFNARPIIQTMAPDSAAEKYGLRVGDQIHSVQGVFINDYNVYKVRNIIQDRGDMPTDIVVKRNQDIMTISVIPDSIVMDSKGGIKKQEIEKQEAGAGEVDAQKVDVQKIEKPKCLVHIGSLGITGYELVTHCSFTEAVKRGITAVNRYIVGTAEGLVNMITRRDTQGLGGPLMIISVASQKAAEGVSNFFFLLSIISVNLAVLNLIPLPIFDGGQILFYAIEAAIRRPLSPRVREYIHIAAWILVMTLILFLSIRDIARIASPYVGTALQFVGIAK